MKCPICKEEMVVEETEIPLYDGAIVVKEDANYCKGCGEHFFDSEQADSVLEHSETLNNLYKIERAIRKSGRGYVIPIPKDMLEYYHAKAGENVSLIPISPRKLIVEFE